ncbi:hypothetical protein L5G32_12345 [Gordonia sp. HY002]|uniref:hypothetical protein n=1 Tax=Gordonia zhenghanii TaxID=2911516 RepID=UPI001EEF8D4B|nr:hypothetical protein [Gordonia zhenghanii]MCF8571059.1 hypothetical protein [Gordonia zhenghanii]MCF8606250.1 hypothetical protein [Gordonia zhenghanii]
MTTSSSYRPIRPPLSRPLIALFVTLFAAGLAQGVAVYIDRSPVAANQVAGTAAWWPHAILAVLTVAFATGVAIRRRRAGRRGSVLLLPVGERASHRVRDTLRSAAGGNGTWRLIAAAPAAVLLYGAFRVGVQVTGGLDPDFTVRAWGGPGYAGAMACHYLAALLMMATAAWLLDKILLPGQPPRDGSGTASTPNAGPAARPSRHL